jgi:hypothetical protein
MPVRVIFERCKWTAVWVGGRRSWLPPHGSSSHAAAAAAAPAAVVFKLLLLLLLQVVCVVAGTTYWLSSLEDQALHCCPR